MIVNLIKLILSILVLLFTEEYFNKLLDLLKLSINSQNIVSLIVYIIIFIIIIIIYKPEITSAFHKYKHKLTTNIFYSIVSFIIVFIGMMIIDYLLIALSKGLNITYEGLKFINIFDYKFSLELIILIIKEIIIKPFIKVTIFVLGINNLFGKRFGTFLSGLIYSLFTMYTICNFNASLLYILINMIPYFTLYSMLSYIYIKNNNIAYSIVSLSLYELFASILIKRFLWGNYEKEIKIFIYIYNMLYNVY